MQNRGFEIIEGVVSAGDCDALLGTLSASKRGRAGARHLMTHPEVRSFGRRQDLLAIARRHVGPGAVPYRATLFEKSGRSNWLVVWHQDTTLPLATRSEDSEWGPWSVKDGVTYAHAPAWALETVVALRIHLDASTDHNGPLRVLPGSHRSGVLTDEEVFRKAKAEAAKDCLVGRGGVLAMRPLLIHASSKAEDAAPRRVLHVEYAASMDLANGLRLVTA